jgi:hypothetical protein
MNRRKTINKRSIETNNHAATRARGNVCHELIYFHGEGKLSAEASINLDENNSRAIQPQ